MATHSSVLAWRIPGTGEPGGLPSLGSHRVGHDWSDLAAAVAAAETSLKHKTIWWKRQIEIRKIYCTKCPVMRWLKMSFLIPFASGKAIENSQKSCGLAWHLKKAEPGKEDDSRISREKEAKNVEKILHGLVFQELQVRGDCTKNIHPWARKVGLALSVDSYLPAQFISVQSLSHVWLCGPMECSTPSLPVHHQLPELTQTHPTELVMPSNHLILCRPLLLPPSLFPSIRVFSNESVLRIRWPWFKRSISFESPATQLHDPLLCLFYLSQTLMV